MIRGLKDIIYENYMERIKTWMGIKNIIHTFVFWFELMGPNIREKMNSLRKD